MTKKKFPSASKGNNQKNHLAGHWPGASLRTPQLRHFRQLGSIGSAGAWGKKEHR